MHNENDRMKTTLEMEKVKLRDEYERIILQKEKDLSATLQKLDEQKKEYQTNLQHVQHKADEAFKLIARQEIELKKSRELLESRNGTDTEGSMALEVSELKHLLEQEKTNHVHLTHRLNDKVLIAERTVLALNTQNSLLEAKEEIIKTLKDKIAVAETRHSEQQQQVEIDTQHLTSHKADEIQTEEEVAEVAVSKGTKESCDFIRIHGTHGVVMNGLLLWANIQRMTRPENAWKEDALTKFVKEEITEAKECLWRISGDKIPGPMKKRQGASKSNSEVNDISGALKALAEKECLPMFLATSDMVKETPVFATGNNENDHEKEMKSRLREMEISMKTILDNTCGASNKPVLKEKLEAANSNRVDVPISWAQVEDVVSPSTPNTEDSPKENWSVVGNKDQKNGKSKRNAWKEKLNILKGTAGGAGNSMIPQSADVHLVAYGFGTDTSSEQIKQWLESNDLQVKGCVLLTRFEGARSLTFRVVVKASDLEKATNPDIWPENVGVSSSSTDLATGKSRMKLRRKYNLSLLQVTEIMRGIETGIR